MSPPQGIATFASESEGLLVVKSASMTLLPGISPSSCTLKTVPQPATLPKVGTLRFLFQGDGADVRIEFPDAAVNLATLRIEGAILWTIEILDRRWKWQFGRISGRYNRRDPDGALIASTEQTPQELATLLLDEIGETDYDVSLLPGNAPEAGPRPEVDWDYSNPAEELQALCDTLAFRVVLHLDNTVKLWPIGTGTALPTQDQIAVGGSIDTTLRPSTIKLVGNPVVFQSRLILEAVGLETDGTLKDIVTPAGGGGLSYRPADGFQQPGYHNDVATDANRRLALQTVYKWYRVKAQADGTQTLPGILDAESNPITLTGIDQIFPLYGGLVEMESVSGVNRPKKPIVEGTFYAEDAILDDETDTTYTGSFSVDAQRGIIQFSQPVFILDSGDFSPADELYLTISYSARDDDDLLIRYTKDRTIDNAPETTDAKIIFQPEAERTIVAAYAAFGAAPSGTTDNLTSVDIEAAYYLDQAEDALGDKEESDARYAGLVALDLDGKREQVSWSVGDDAAITSASLDSRANPWAPNYDEKRSLEQIPKNFKRTSRLLDERRTVERFGFA